MVNMSSHTTQSCSTQNKDFTTVRISPLNELIITYKYVLIMKTFVKLLLSIINYIERALILSGLPLDNFILTLNLPSRATKANIFLE